jgi:CBS domain containing-hemolysin-like protein
MTEPELPPEKARTGALWGVLAVLLVFGAVGSATFVDGFLGLLAGSWFSVIVAVVGAFVALLSVLFMIGILYRVDRLRGAVGRKVAFFE